jgi:hypothetical protein
MIMEHTQRVLRFAVIQSVLQCVTARHVTEIAFIEAQICFQNWSSVSEGQEV